MSNPADRELVNATIAMAHAVGLTVVAEGVETEEQLSFLVERGCDLAQGYLFSWPVSIGEFLEICRTSPTQVTALPFETLWPHEAS